MFTYVTRMVCVRKYVHEYLFITIDLFRDRFI